jgi:hypothetical protein
MASIVVCAEPGSWQQASRFAQRALGNAELKSFEAIRRRAPESCRAYHKTKKQQPFTQIHRGAGRAT